MGKSLESLSKGPWIDLYTGDTFGGKFSRFHAGRRGKSGYANPEKLKIAGSLIVGPGTIARVKLEGERKILALRPGTMVADLAELSRNRPIVSLEIAKDSAGTDIAKPPRRRRSAAVLAGV